ncbi:MAG: sigma 54-interacting transcriptional regulator [Coriobacteriales bacterium]|nr:sigma 54-interacting transcriptional regulator [Coriobacteriales bacterium]
MNRSSATADRARPTDSAGIESQRQPKQPKHDWNAIVAARKAFLANGTLPQSPPVQPEVLQSWQRCREMGIDPERSWLCQELSEAEYENVFATHQELVSAVRPYLDMIDNLGLTHDYIFELVAENGTSLLQKGDLSLHTIVSDKAVFGEETMGTNAHTLCMRHNRPIQVMGAEHYCSALLHLAASAAPICNREGAVIASLLLTQPLPETPWAPAYHKLSSYTLGLLTSISAAVENQLRFTQYYDQFKDLQGQFNDLVLSSSQIRHILDTAVDTSNDSIVVIYPDGSIAGVNLNASHLLRTSAEELVGLPVKEMLGVNWPEEMFDYLNSPYEKSVTINSRTFRLVANPITNKNTHELESILIKLRDINKVSRQSASVGDAAEISFADILGPSQALRDVRALARRFSTTSENVLVVGESGSGKEYFAQAMHNESRPDGPFMSINCAAIPPRLIESELFGYEGGSFTGADRRGKPGKIELAHNGTLFLDEIGDMPLELQATLLRVLENKRVMRLGGKAYKPVDFRLIAATNRNLFKMVDEGNFREDLFYRLSVLTFTIPPLRERGDDLQFFIDYYLDECHRQNAETDRHFSAEAMQVLQDYSWPGNVRQVRNVVYSSYYAASGDSITPAELPAYLLGGAALAAQNSDEAASMSAADSAGHTGTQTADAAGGAPVPTASNNGPQLSASLQLSKLEEDAVRAAYEQSDHNVAQTARTLGISTATAYRKLKALGIG